MKKFLLSLALMLPLSSFASILIVDYNKIRQESKEFVSIQKKYEAEQLNLQSKYQKIKQEGLQTDEEIKKMLQKDLAILQNKIKADDAYFSNKLLDIVEDVRKKRKADAVVRKAMILTYDKSKKANIDISQDVIKKLNSSYK